MAPTLEPLTPSQAGVAAGLPPPASELADSASLAVSGRTVISAWLVSLAVHTAVFIGMFLLVFPYSPNVEADAPLARTEVVGEIDADPSDPAAKTPITWSPPEFATTPNTAYDASDLRFGARMTDRLQEMTPLGGTGQGTAGAGEGGDPGLSIMGIGGDEIASGSGDFSKFGLGGGGLGSEFFGLGRSARGVQRIVYVVDRSGSMADTFGFVRQELRRSVGLLRRSQKFHVIFFSSGDTVENPPLRLVSAITAHKQQFYKFLDHVAPGGATDPSPAMRRALSLEPDVIFFLTDGEFDKSLVPRLNEWNKDRRTKIFTIAFFGADGADLLEQIAREHGGEYRFVSENDLP